MPGDALVYKLVPASLWREAEALGRFTGSPVDRADGYIHFSTAAQVAETAAKYFTGVPDLLLVAVATDRLDPAALRYEPSRGGALFPHLYADLPLLAVRAVHALPMAADGRHAMPELS